MRYVFTKAQGFITAVLLAALGAVQLILPKSAFAQVPTGSYLGQYYNGRNFDNLVLTRTDSEINFVWGHKSPAPGTVSADNFSVRWQGNFVFDADEHVFTAFADDGIRVWVDGDQIIDAWRNQRITRYEVRRNMTSGTHNIRVEYFEAKSGAVARLFWNRYVPAQTGTTVTQGGTIGPQLSPPQFPSCANQVGDGDWFHSDYGTFPVPGENTPITGNIDIYFLNGNGNMLQCLCRAGTREGIQTNYWKIGGLNLADSQISSYRSSGWILLDGEDFDLLSSEYLSRSVSYTCPAAAPLPTTTPTPVPPSRCVSLSAEPVKGTVPLTVSFKGVGEDPEGEIERYRFDFGYEKDGKQVTAESDTPQLTQTYQLAGRYSVSLQVLDSKGNWREGDNDSCKVDIEALEKAVGGITELPDTGIPGKGAVLLALAGILGGVFFRLSIVSKKAGLLRKLSPHSVGI